MFIEMPSVHFSKFKVPRRQARRVRVDAGQGREGEGCGQEEGLLGGRRGRRQNKENQNVSEKEVVVQIFLYPFDRE